MIKRPASRSRGGKGKGKGRGKKQEVGEQEKPKPKRARKASPKDTDVEDKATTPKKGADAKKKPTPKKSPQPKTGALKRPAGKVTKTTSKDKDKSDKVPKDPEEPTPKASRTWAGRWIPDESLPAGKRFAAIRRVFDLFLASKFSRQSAAQSPFFKLCSESFRKLGIDKDDTTIEQYQSTAECQVEPFLQDERIRILMISSTIHNLSLSPLQRRTRMFG